MSYYIDNETYNYLIIRISELLEDVEDLKKVVANLQKENEGLRKDLERDEKFNEWANPSDNWGCYT